MWRVLYVFSKFAKIVFGRVRFNVILSYQSYFFQTFKGKLSVWNIFHNILILKYLVALYMLMITICPKISFEYVIVLVYFWAIILERKGGVYMILNTRKSLFLEMLYLTNQTFLMLLRIPFWTIIILREIVFLLAPLMMSIMMISWTKKTFSSQLDMGSFQDLPMWPRPMMRASSQK